MVTKFNFVQEMAILKLKFLINSIHNLKNIYSYIKIFLGQSDKGKNGIKKFKIKVHKYLWHSMNITKIPSN